MKVAIASDTYPPQVNGAAYVVYTSAEALKGLGHEVRVLTPADTLSFAFPWYKGHRVAVPVGKIFFTLRKFRPDVIHIHTPFGVGWEAAVAARLLSIPLVGTNHNFFDQNLRHVHLDYKSMIKFSWKFVLLIYGMCDVIVSPSKSLANAMAPYAPHKKIVVIPNPCMIDPFTPVSEEKKESAKIILMSNGVRHRVYGKIELRKSLEVAVKAFARIEQKRQDITFLIVGDGPERENLQALAAKVKIKNIVFTGMLHGEDLARSIQASDIFLTTSKSENLPVSIAQAMAAGLPIVGVDALGIPEMAHSGINGTIVPQDDVEAIAEACLTLIEDKDLRKKYGSASREFVLEYEQNAITKQFITLYEELTA